MNPAAREIVTVDGVVLRVGTIADGEFMRRSGLTVESAAGGGGAPVGAPVGATYVTLTTDATLTQERTLAVGTGLDLVDGGAGAAVTVQLDLSEVSASGDLTGTMDAPTLAAGCVAAAEVAATLKPSGSAAAGDEALRALGTTSSTACAGNDSRLTDSRAPTGAAGGDLSGTYPSPSVAKVVGMVPSAFGLARLADADDIAARTGLGLAAVAASGSASDLTTGTLPAARLPALSGDVSSSAGSASVTVTYARGLRETSGPTVYPMGPAAEGQYLRIVGGACIGVYLAAGAVITSGNIELSAPGTAILPIVYVTAGVLT